MYGKHIASCTRVFIIDGLAREKVSENRVGAGGKERKNRRVAAAAAVSYIILYCIRVCPPLYIYIYACTLCSNEVLKNIIKKNIWSAHIVFTLYNNIMRRKFFRPPEMVAGTAL